MMGWVPYLHAMMKIFRASHPCLFKNNMYCMHSRAKIVGQCWIFSLKIASTWLLRLFSPITTAGIFIFFRKFEYALFPESWQTVVFV